MASLSEIDPYARYFAKQTGVAQVVWECPAVNTHGRTPLPEWNAMHRNSRYLRIAKVVQPGEKQ